MKHRLFKQCVVQLSLLISISTTSYAEILWKQDFNNSPAWQSTPHTTDDVNGVRRTHQDAVFLFNASSYRISKQRYFEGGTIMLEISTIADRQGNGKGLVYYMNGVEDGIWQAASVDLTFSDPDVTWQTDIDRSGYAELWLTIWYKTPEKMIWYDPARGEDVAVGYEAWKGCRFYAYDVEQFIDSYNANNGTSFGHRPDDHWSILFNSNASLSSHYLDYERYYKKPLYIFAWYGQTLYHDPCWLKETDPDGGTSTISHAHDRNDVTTHLLEGKIWWSNYISGDVPGILGDLQWHKIEYHVKLNDLGESNSIEEVYIDGNPTPLSTVANNQEIRVTDRKFQDVILFDNYFKKYGGKQKFYIDDITLSTTRLSDEAPRILRITEK